MTQRELKTGKQTKFSLMLAKPYDPARIHHWKHVIAEPKLDGVRIIAVCSLKKDRVAYYSRNGRQLYMFAHIDKEVRKFVQRAGDLYDERFWQGTVLDGEMTHLSGEFGLISGAIHTKDYTEFDARFSVFHAMPFETFDKGRDDVPMIERMRMCRKIIKGGKLKMIQHNVGIACKSDEDVQQAYADHIRAGYEGTIVKLARYEWEGKRSFSWMKMKPQETYECIVKGVKLGKGKYEGTLGALVLDYNGKECRTSGMTDAERDEMWRMHKRNKLKGRMVEVEAQLVTKAGALRHPRFKRFRPDKESLKEVT
jgi:DNA ligase-1